jgi:hypothetical protein
MRHLQRIFLIGTLSLSTLVLPCFAAAAPPLSDAQKATLTADLAERQPYARIISGAVTAGMDCEEVVFFLCDKSGNGAAQVYDIVYAGVTGGCDAAKVVSGALRAGAELNVVVRAARTAGASRDAISSAATSNNFTPEQVSSAFAMMSGGVTGGGRLGDGSALDSPVGGGPVGGGTISGGSIGGGAGGSVPSGGPASPFKP